MSGAGWLSVNSAAVYLDTTPGALRKRVERGQVKAYRLGGSIRLRRADIDALMVPVGAVVEPVKAAA